MAYKDLLTENARVIDEFLQAQFLSPAASPSLSSSWQRSPLPAPTNVVSFTHQFDTTGARRSTRTSCHAVLASLDEALQALNTDVTTTLRRVESELLGADLLLDAQVLDTLQPRTKECQHEYIGLKHLKYRSLADETHAEEFLLLETMGKGVHPLTGMPFGFKFAASVDLPEWEFEINSSNSHHAGIQVHRGIVHSLLILVSETTHRGILKMQVWLDVDLTPCDEPFYGGFSSLHDAFSLAIRYRHVIESASTSGFTSTALQFLPAGSAGAFREKKCQTCEKKLGLFSRKKHHLCAICGLFVCSNCLTPTDFNTWKLCVHCFERNERLVMRTRVSRLASIGANLSGLVTRIARSYSRQRESVNFAHMNDRDGVGGGERGSMVGMLQRENSKNTRYKSSLLRMTALHKANSGRSAYETIIENEESDLRASLFDGTSATFLANHSSSKNGPRSRSDGDKDKKKSPYEMTTRASLQMQIGACEYIKAEDDEQPEGPDLSASLRVPGPSGGLNSTLRISELGNKTVISNVKRPPSSKFPTWNPSGSTSKLKLLDEDIHSRLSSTGSTWRSTGDFREDFSASHTRGSTIELSASDLRL